MERHVTAARSRGRDDDHTTGCRVSPDFLRQRNHLIVKTVFHRFSPVRDLRRRTEIIVRGYRSARPTEPHSSRETRTMSTLLNRTIYWHILFEIRYRNDKNMISYVRHIYVDISYSIDDLNMHSECCVRRIMYVIDPRDLYSTR